MKSPEFSTWLDTKKHFISDLHTDNTALLSFSDGSVRLDKDFHSTAAYLLSYQGTITRSRLFASGQATSFDAELSGLVAALHDSIRVAQNNHSITAIHLFADNAAALDSLFRPTFYSF